MACFDTAFHRGHSAVADHYAIPEHFYREGVRRYGFHGLSYEYIAGRLVRRCAPTVANGRVIVAHLGSGASMCALAGGKSIESTMGFTALDGLPMGTRPGQIDPGVLLYLMTEKAMVPAAIENLLYHESGLKGLSASATTCANSRRATSQRGACHRLFCLSRRIERRNACRRAWRARRICLHRRHRREFDSIRTKIAEKLAWLGVIAERAENRANR